MTKENLERANQLIKEIEICKQQIEFFEYSQCDNVVERVWTLEHNGSMVTGKIPSTLWRSIGKIVLNEWKLKLIESQNELDWL
jgi:hypothetical protein